MFPTPTMTNDGLPPKVGTYNREFAKRRVKQLDKVIGKDGEHLDTAKAKQMLVEGETNRASSPPKSVHYCTLS